MKLGIHHQRRWVSGGRGAGGGGRRCPGRRAASRVVVGARGARRVSRALELAGDGQPRLPARLLVPGDRLRPCPSRLPGGADPQRASVDRSRLPLRNPLEGMALAGLHRRHVLPRDTAARFALCELLPSGRRRDAGRTGGQRSALRGLPLRWRRGCAPRRARAPALDRVRPHGLDPLHRSGDRGVLLVARPPRAGPLARRLAPGLLLDDVLGGDGRGVRDAAGDARPGSVRRREATLARSLRRHLLSRAGVQNTALGRLAGGAPGSTRDRGRGRARTTARRGLCQSTSSIIL